MSEVVALKPGMTYAEITPLALIQMAVEKGVDASQMERLVALHERWTAARAAERFGEALAKFQAECPPVKKTRSVSNKDKSLRYKFAGWEDVMALAAPHLKANGISVSFSTPKDDGDSFTMNCRLQVGSHYEDRPFTGPKPNLDAIAKSMYLTEPQAFGLVLSYFKRYAFCAAAGVVVCDEDNDAQGDTADPLLSKEEIVLFNETWEECEKLGAIKDLDRFLKWLNVECVEQLTRTRLTLALREMARKRKAVKA